MLFRVFFLTAVFCLIFNTVRLPFGGLGLSDVFIFGALAILGLEYLRHKGRDGWDIPLHALWPGAILVLIGGLVSSMFAYQVVTSAAITVKTFFVTSIWISMTMVVVRRGGFAPVLVTFVAAAAFTSGVALVERFVSIGRGFQITFLVPNYWDRATGTVGHPVELGLVTSVALPLSVGLWLHESQTRRRGHFLLLLGVGIVLIISAVLFAGSVAGWISTFVSMGIFGLILLSRAPVRVRAGLIACVLALTVIGFVYLSDPVRIAAVSDFLVFNIGRASTTTGPGRFALMGEALDAISFNPMIGSGMDQTGTGGIGNDQLVTSRTVHNPILAGWVGGGILVLLGLLWCYFVVLLTAINTLAHGVNRTNWILIGLGACLVGWLIFDQSQSHLYHRYTWLTLGVAFGMGYGIRITAPRREVLDSLPPVVSPSAASPQIPR